jgi:hypothetical protein
MDLLMGGLPTYHLRLFRPKSFSVRQMEWLEILLSWHNNELYMLFEIPPKPLDIMYENHGTKINLSGGRILFARLAIIIIKPLLIMYEAIAIAAKALRLNKEEIDMIKATVMFKPSDITHIRTYPFWKITFKEKILYVDQLGNVYGAIKLSVPGD